MCIALLQNSSQYHWFLAAEREVNQLKKISVVVLVLAFSLALVAVVPIQAKKPLYGEMFLEFNLAWSGYQTDVPDWVGSITIDGKEYGMLFFAFWTGKPFDDPAHGMAFFFGEIWAIYDMDGLEFPVIPNGEPGDWAYWVPTNDPAELVMWGYDEGITNMANTKFHMSGNVVEAFGDFSMWEGRNVHMSGTIEWYEEIPAPHFAPGIFRIN